MMMTWDRNHNAITTGSRVMINGTGKTGLITAIHGEGKTAEQIQNSKCVEVEGCEGQFEPTELFRLGLH